MAKTENEDSQTWSVGKVYRVPSGVTPDMRPVLVSVQYKTTADVGRSMTEQIVREVPLRVRRALERTAAREIAPRP